MGIMAHNTTGVPLAVKDYYIWDAAFNSGYYGDLEYLIPARRQKLLSCSIFTRKLMEEKKPQEIHVRIGEETRLVLHREDFENNREVVFEIGNDGVLTARFTRRGETSFADRIWALIPFCGAGDNMEASVARVSQRRRRKEKGGSSRVSGRKRSLKGFDHDLCEKHERDTEIERGLDFV